MPKRKRSGSQDWVRSRPFSCLELLVKQTVLAPAGGTARPRDAVIKRSCPRSWRHRSTIVSNDPSGGRQDCGNRQHTRDTTQPEVGRSSGPGSCLRAESFVNSGSGGLSAVTRSHRVSPQRHACSHKGVMFAGSVCATSSDPARPGL